MDEVGTRIGLQEDINFVKNVDLVNGEKNKGEWVALKPNGK